MPQPVAIIGSGQTHHASKRLDVNIPELVHEAVSRAFENTGLSPKDIDAYVIGNMEFFEGINLSDLWASEGAGSYLKPSMKIATGGTTGTSLAACGYYHCASGMFDTVCVIGWEKQSESDTTGGIITVFDPFIERQTVTGAIGVLALEASSYTAKYKIPAEVCAQAAVLARDNAKRNPHAHLKLDLTVEKVLNSPMIAYPIHRFEMCPTSDGACAVIFAGGEKAKKLCKKPAWLKAAVSKHNHPFIADCDLENLPLGPAAREAFRIAGVKAPMKEIDVIELYDPASFTWVSWTEKVLQLKPGAGRKLVENGTISFDGKIPVNPSGGVLSTNPIGATGLIRVAEAAMQVQGLAGDHQVPGVRTTVATGFGGYYWYDVFVISDKM